MFQLQTRPADGSTFTTTLNGESHTYPSTKEGKRQAILDGLTAIPTVMLGEEVYLPSDVAMQVVAAVMYPDGIQTAVAYKTAEEVTQRACAYLEYGEEVTLNPPDVPFPQRGNYRRKYPPVDSQMVVDTLELAGVSSTLPQWQILCPTIWNTIGYQVYQTYWHSLAAERQRFIQMQVDTLAEQAGWQVQETNGNRYYVRDLLPDLERARQKLQIYLNSCEGWPVSVRLVVTEVQLAAYGRSFDTLGLCPELAEIVRQSLETAGYLPQPANGEYHTHPITLSPEMEQQLADALSQVPLHTTKQGGVLLVKDIHQLITSIVGQASQWAIEQLITQSAFSQLLQQQGFKTQTTWCQPYEFEPPLMDGEPRAVLYKEVRIQHNPEKRLTLADGLPVYTPALVMDEQANTLVYLEMVGNKQAVQANWAALMGKNKIHWIGSQRIHLNGMERHVRLHSPLPCGWVDCVLLHKQASLKELIPTEPFYLLDDDKQPIPSLFYPMLNKCLALPLLESWTAYLWTQGREQKLIILLNKGEGQGYAAWRVLPAPEEWQAVIEEGLKTQEIRF